MVIDLPTALGLLLRDAELRVRFRAAAHDVADELFVSNAERSAFLSLDPNQLDAQAHSLILKRFGEVAGLLPRSVAALGASAAPLFNQYAPGNWPEGHKRHVQDAAAFARYLQHREIAVSGPELNSAVFAAGGARVTIRLPRIIVGARSRRAVQVLFRGRRRVRQMFFYLGAVG